jgi:hypothetical protein
MKIGDCIATIAGERIRFTRYGYIIYIDNPDFHAFPFHVKLDDGQVGYYEKEELRFVSDEEMMLVKLERS